MAGVASVYGMTVMLRCLWYDCCVGVAMVWEFPHNDYGAGMPMERLVILEGLWNDCGVGMPFKRLPVAVMPVE